jgi:hypothetical protein
MSLLYAYYMTLPTTEDRYAYFRGDLEHNPGFTTNTSHLDLSQTSWEFEVDVRFDGKSGENYFIDYAGAPSAANYKVVLIGFLSPTSMAFHFWGQNWTLTIPSSTAWHRWRFVYDKPNLKRHIYRDDVLLGTFTTNAFTGTGKTITVGARGGSVSFRNLQGGMDNLILRIDGTIAMHFKLNGNINDELGAQGTVDGAYLTFPLR